MNNTTINIDAERCPPPTPAAFADNRFKKASDAYAGHVTQDFADALLELAQDVLDRTDDPILARKARVWIKTLRHRLKK